jgi:hypothetical protein
MKKLEKIDYLQKNHLYEWVKTHAQVERELSGRAAFLFVKIFDILLVYLYLCYNISTVCELKERNSEVKRSYVF